MSNGTSNACGTCGSVVYPHVCAVPAAPVAGSYAVTTNITYAPQPPSSDVLVRPDFDGIERRHRGHDTPEDDDLCNLLAYARAAASRIETLEKEWKRWQERAEEPADRELVRYWAMLDKGTIKMLDEADIRARTAEARIKEEVLAASKAIADLTADLTRAREEAGALRRVVAQLDEHMVWDVAYESGNTYSVQCVCGWYGTVEGCGTNFKKRAALWAAHVRVALSGSTSTETSPAREERQMEQR